ncbi:hypothetical protein FRB94_011682 [Tulasnella sp. JGI-2019a]|nr:hypothetical protein FRB93_001072 [Tulasnella sp. JGI-2019a]KAG9009677.1 hypothetical protein FRB94_011682 [Tulasnella sp. JGI-2019a]KAG9034355.1 hypothetical protein FRB95_013391 [Tulasnella sp. JGI-2019a]
MAVLTIGVLALQGGFSEHITSLQRLQLHSVRVVPIQVKTPSDLAQCDALIIPGGESTTIALLARLSGLLEPLREFVNSKPIWGTCAGAILLAREAVGTKKGGQEVLSGVDVKVQRNGWGSQMESFEAEMTVEGMRNMEKPFRGVFIRAPVVLEVLSTSHSRSPVRVMARLSDWVAPSIALSPCALQNVAHSGQCALPTPPNEPEPMQPDDPRHIVALMQGRHLFTTFHPELTRDDRFHELFVTECVAKSNS